MRILSQILLWISLLLFFYQVSGLNKHQSLKLKSFLSNSSNSSEKSFNLTNEDRLFLQKSDHFIAKLEATAINKNVTLPEYIMEKLAKGLSEEITNSHYTGWECEGCELLFSQLNSLVINDKAINITLEAIFKLCSRILNSSVCQGTLFEYGKSLIINLAKKNLNSKVVCWRLGFCPNKYYFENFTQYAKDLLQDKPEFSPPKPSKRSTYKLLHITDLHVDLNYKAGFDSFCNEPLCCREENGFPKNPEHAAGYWGTVGGCDIPLRTLEEAFRFISESVKPEVVIWTGDNVAHDIWKQNTSFQAIPTKIATRTLQKLLPNVTIYPIFGNHECFPADQFDFFSNTTKWLTDATSDMWKDLIGENAAQSLKSNSYYEVFDAGRNLRIIAMNTQVCDTLNFFLMQNPTDPWGELKWLKSVLKDAEEKNQSAFIFAHIPSSDQFCHTEWARHYNIIIERFGNVIRGQFFGHTHFDQFQYYRGFFDNIPFGAAFIAPSMTTYTNLNPSFRVFEVDRDTNTLLNYQQYRLNLSKVNNEKANFLEWDVVYDFLRDYNVPDLSPSSMAELSRRIYVNFKKYYLVLKIDKERCRNSQKVCFKLLCWRT